jgi:Xaa-Pro aminopeptidase
MQGHIALDTAVWPEGTTGFSLDTLARMHLWRAGLDYRHGTGHGVGAALNVHEGPQARAAAAAVLASCCVARVSLQCDGRTAS